jgi:hypothetical protein
MDNYLQAVRLEKRERKIHSRFFKGSLSRSHNMNNAINDSHTFIAIMTAPPEQARVGRVE